MGIGSGLGSSVGFASEGTYGTYQAPTKWCEGTAKLQLRPNHYQGGGMAAGRFVRPGSRRYRTHRGAGGTLEMAAYSKQMGLFLNALMGGTVTPVQQGATAAYLATHALADPYGKSLTVQAGVPELTGTSRPYTFLGCQILSAEFSCEIGGPLSVSFEVEARDATEAQTLAAPSYVAMNEFHWGQATCKLGAFGAEAGVDGITKMSLKISRPRHPGGPYMGNGGLRSQGVANAWAEISGTIDADYLDKQVFADRFAANSSTSLVWEFVGPNIASTFFETFRFKVPMIFFDGATPMAESADVVKGSFPFVGDFDLTNNPCTIETISTDISL